jgi:hypothetical protein
MKTRTAVLMISLLATASLAQAQKIYMCKDATGRTLTSDRPIPECADRTVKEMDRNGMVRREIAPPLTAEQKRQKQAEEEKRTAEAAAAAEQKQADRAIQARYRSESDIEVARKRTADVVYEQIKRESAALAAAEKRKKDAQAEAAQVKGRKDMSPAMARKLEEADQAVSGSRKKIQEYEAEVAQVDEKFAATLKRYRELNAANSSAANPTAAVTGAPTAAPSAATVTKTSASIK